MDYPIKRGPNSKAVLTDKAVNGIEKLLGSISLPAHLIVDPEILAAINFLTKTVTKWRNPETIARRKQNVAQKQEWENKKREAGELPPKGKQGRKKISP